MFNFPSKINYALIGLYDIALHGKKNPVPLSAIVARKKVPKAYLEIILAKLVKNKILISKKGVRGGFLYNKKLKEISLLNLYEILEKKKKINTSKTIKNKKAQAMVSKTYHQYNDHVIKYLNSQKLNIVFQINKKIKKIIKKK